MLREELLGLVLDRRPPSDYVVTTRVAPTYKNGSIPPTALVVGWSQERRKTGSMPVPGTRVPWTVRLKHLADGNAMRVPKTLRDNRWSTTRMTIGDYRPDGLNVKRPKEPNVACVATHPSHLQSRLDIDRGWFLAHSLRGALCKILAGASGGVCSSPKMGRLIINMLNSAQVSIQRFDAARRRGLGLAPIQATTLRTSFGRRKPQAPAALIATKPPMPDEDDHKSFLRLVDAEIAAAQRGGFVLPRIQPVPATLSFDPPVMFIRVLGKNGRVKQVDRRMTKPASSIQTAKTKAKKRQVNQEAFRQRQLAHLHMKRVASDWSLFTAANYVSALRSSAREDRERVAKAQADAAALHRAQTDVKQNEVHADAESLEIVKRHVEKSRRAAGRFFVSGAGVGRTIIKEDGKGKGKGKGKSKRKRKRKFADSSATAAAARFFQPGAGVPASRIVERANKHQPRSKAQDGSVVRGMMAVLQGGCGDSDDSEVGE